MNAIRHLETAVIWKDTRRANIWSWEISVLSVRSPATEDCEDCSLDFRSKYGLRSHINKAHREVPIEYVCEICRQGGFFSPQDKSIHKMKFHKDERGERKTEKPKFECEKFQMVVQEWVKTKRSLILPWKKRWLFEIEYLCWTKKSITTRMHVCHRWK